MQHGCPNSLSLSFQKPKLALSILSGKVAEIKFTEMPTAAEINSRQQKVFSQTLTKEAIHENASAILTGLQDALSLEEITLRLISLYWRKAGLSKNKNFAPPSKPTKRGKRSNERFSERKRRSDRFSERKTTRNKFSAKKANGDKFSDRKGSKKRFRKV